VKLLLVSLGSLLLWRHRKRAGAVVAIFVAFMVYYLIVLYHLQAMDLRLFDRLFG
jgi:CHASE2 domain-containing sensor protein